MSSFQREARQQVEGGWWRRRRWRARSCRGRGWGCAIGRHVRGRCRPGPCGASSSPRCCSARCAARPRSAPTPTSPRRAPPCGGTEGAQWGAGAATATAAAGQQQGRRPPGQARWRLGHGSSWAARWAPATRRCRLRGWRAVAGRRLVLRPAALLRDAAQRQRAARGGDQLRAALLLWLAGGGRPHQLPRRHVSAGLWGGGLRLGRRRGGWGGWGEGQGGGGARGDGGGDGGGGVVEGVDRRRRVGSRQRVGVHLRLGRRRHGGDRLGRRRGAVGGIWRSRRGWRRVGLGRRGIGECGVGDGGSGGGVEGMGQRLERQLALLRALHHEDVRR